MYKCKFVLILFLISFPFFSYSNDGTPGIIKERMDKFQESKNLMRTINKSFSDNNFDVITQSAEKLNKWANEMHEYFPKGSEANTSNKSQARDNIWSDPEGFKNYKIYK